MWPALHEALSSLKRLCAARSATRPVSRGGAQRMNRFMEIKLETRNVTCVARLLDQEAALTCDIVWNALPLGGDALHAKYAMNERSLLPGATDPRRRARPRELDCDADPG